MNWVQKSYSVDGSLPNRMAQFKEVKLMSQRSVMRTDVEAGMIAQIFVENEHRQKMREFFDTLNSNDEGDVSIREVKTHMRSYLESRLERHIISQIFKKYDENSDEMLSFEEFYQMSVSKHNKFHRMVSKYCEIVVPHQDPMDDLYEDTMSCWPPPLTMITFSIVQIIFFFIEACNNSSGECYFCPEKNNTITISLEYDACKRFEIWRFISYMFVHSDGAHLMGNLIMQICFGIPLELVNHWHRVTLIYLSGVLAGSLCHSVTNVNYLCGASAGVFALLVAHIATVIMNWHEMYHPIFQLTFFLIYCGADFSRSFVEYKVGNSKTSYVTHLGGAIAGLLVGIGVLRNLNERPWERTLWFCALALFISLLVAGIFINIFYFDSFVQVTCHE